MKEHKDIIIDIINLSKMVSYMYNSSSVFLTEFIFSHDFLHEEHERCKYWTILWNTEFTSGVSGVRISQSFVPRVLFCGSFFYNV